MKRYKSKMVFVKKRIKAVQRKAKWTGFFYLLGTIVLLAAAAVLGMVKDTVLTKDGAMPIMGAINALSGMDFGGVLKSPAAVAEVVMVAIYLVTVLALLINVIRAFSNLGWLYKRRPSYTQGFNRNMYAMDEISARFCGSLAAYANGLIIVYLMQAVVAGSAAIDMMALIVLAAGLVIHFLTGMSEAKVTLFTTGDRVEEETREFGRVAFFFRSLVQVLVAFGAVYLLLTNTGAGAGDFGKTLFTADGLKLDAALSNAGLIPVALEILTWLFVFGLVKRATSAVEFNREGMEAHGIKAFRVLAIFATVITAGWAFMAEMNVMLFVAAAVMLVGFILDCIIHPSYKDSDNEMELGMDEYFTASEEMARYNNTII